MSARFLIFTLALTPLASCTLEPTPVDAGDEDDDAGVPDAGPDLCDVEPIEGGAIDVGIHCANLSIEIELMTTAADATLVASALPDGIELVYVAPVWVLRGTLPDTDFAVDAAFEATLTEPPTDDEECERVTLFDVRFIIDSCDSPRVCDAIFSAFPIDGFCVPPRIDANAAFAITTMTSACLSSACTDVQPAGCDVVVTGDQVSIAGSVCTRALDLDGCTPDCGGGNGAPCVVPPLAAGQYVLSSTSGTITIDVPRDEDLPACVFP